MGIHLSPCLFLSFRSHSLPCVYPLDLSVNHLSIYHLYVHLRMISLFHRPTIYRSSNLMYPSIPTHRYVFTLLSLPIYFYFLPHSLSPTYLTSVPTIYVCPSTWLGIIFPSPVSVSINQSINHVSIYHLSTSTHHLHQSLYHLSIERIIHLSKLQLSPAYRCPLLF